MNPPIPPIELTRIGPPGAITAFSYYNTTPESPDASRLVYARFDRREDSGNTPVTGSLWTCRPDGSNHRKIVDLAGLTVHNAAAQQWIDDATIAYEDGGSVHVIDLDGRPIVDPVPGGLEHEPHGRRVLISRRPGSGQGPTGAYELDVDTGELRLICTPADFAGFADRFPPDYRRDQDTWAVLHLQYNPSATRIAMRFDMGKGEPYRYVITCDLAGGAPICFGPKPMHFIWFDDETLMGHDHQVADGLADDRCLRRYTLTGQAVETLAGPGNHTGAAPNRSLYASETWYHEPVIRVSLYRRGQTPPAAVLAEHDRAKNVWGLTFHVNPSFSRDSRRVYFTHIDEAGLPCAVTADVDALC
jgi:hypothetical protein